MNKFAFQKLLDNNSVLVGELEMDYPVSGERVMIRLEPLTSSEVWGVLWGIHKFTIYVLQIGLFLFTALLLFLTSSDYQSFVLVSFGFLQAVFVAIIVQQYMGYKRELRKRKPPLIISERVFDDLPSD